MDVILDWTLDSRTGDERPLAPGITDSTIYQATAQFGIFDLCISRRQILKDGRMQCSCYLACSTASSHEIITLVSCTVGNWVAAVKVAEDFLFRKNYRTPDHVIKITEENVDGCGGDASVYAGFTGPLNADLQTQLTEILKRVKQEHRSDDFDTEDFVEEALAEFNQPHADLSQTVFGRILSQPFTGEIKF